MTAAATTKLCECGCGAPAPIARCTQTKIGHVKGEPVRFISGHNKSWAGRSHTPETKARISATKWKGGTRVAGGRTHVRVPLGHPMRTATGYAFGYRLAMAEALGRMLSSNEVVHHINLDSMDDRLENLILLNPSQHSRLHRRIAQGEDQYLALIDICREDAPGWVR